MGYTDDNHADDHVGARIRAARGWAGLNQGEFGKRVGLGREAVIALEADKRQPTVPELRRISRATGVPVSFLLHGWEASADLLERVATLEKSVSLGRHDRDELAREIEAQRGALETLARELQTGAAAFAEQFPALEQRLTRLEHRLAQRERRTP